MTKVIVSMRFYVYRFFSSKYEQAIDNRARRIATLQEIIQHLHKGEAPKAVKSQLREMVQQTNPSEIMAMEQELISGGMPVEKVKSMCDLHSQVTRELLVQLPAASIAPGHPGDTFRRENAAIREVIAKLRNFQRVFTRPDNEECSPQLLQIKHNAKELMDIDKHYQRKEHALFSFLEKHPVELFGEDWFEWELTSQISPATGNAQQDETPNQNSRND